MDLSIIIVSYNTQKLLLRCLKSVYASLSLGPASLTAEVIVIDNASTDGSVPAVKTQYPQVICLTNLKNIGFGAANNIAAAQAKGDYYLFLNSDTECLKAALPELFNAAVSHKTGLATGRLLNPDLSLQPQGGFLPSVINVLAWQLFVDDLPLIRAHFPAYQLRWPGFFNTDRRFGWIGGTAMLIERRLFQALNGFNPAIFMYGEDVDLCFRASQQGVEAWYFHQPAFIHLGQQSGSSLQAIVGEYRFISAFFTRHASPVAASLVRLILKIGAFVRLLLFGKIGGHDLKAQAYRQVQTVV